MLDIMQAKIGLIVIFIAVLVLPFRVRAIERNLEIFLVISGVLAPTLSGFILLPGEQTGWSWKILTEALTTPLNITNIYGIPAGIVQIVLLVGIIIYVWYRQIGLYLQVDNGMSFAGDYIHPRSFSRFVRLYLYVGIGVVFIAPAKPWMNGTIEEFNKGFDRLFWRQETFTDLTDIQIKSEIFCARQNKFYNRKLREKDLKSIIPKQLLRPDFEIDVNNILLVAGRIHFIRMVDSRGDVSVLNERFHVGGEYIGEYSWATVDTKRESLVISYNDEKMVVHEIKRFDYGINEKVHEWGDLFFPFKSAG